ncbi:hypothetical protein SMSP2_00542 [Limihaloglobus sulfuriphilus]|uniref:Uncharacterized protein n=1 Tax=Limihaloglobus sulfuriphilus TaxID=1851148 RepID=A0A1Q2MC11_9BACT|nr:hypothetical protein [Limihaloglobus sulfuriphilus]AQQ70199.1 hypothetical protein SMSP2_00542 [Limihaloglobus sulfuriphilus]
MKYLRIIKDFIKHYSSLALPVGLLLAAVIVFFVTKGINSGVQESVASSLNTGEAVSRFLRNAPSAEEAEAELAYQQKHKTDAERVQQLVHLTTQRELIAYNIFPEPTDRSRYIFDNYAKKYIEAVTEMFNEVNAGDAPSENELQADLAGAANTRNMRNVDENTQKIIDARCKARARSIGLYARPQVFDWYNYWSQYQYSGRASAIYDCWYSQIAFWVYQDVMDTIITLKGDHNSLLASPVKRLGRVSFRSLSAINLQTMDKSKATAQKDVPYMITDQRPPILVEDSWTGRVGDEERDVFHFSISVIVEVDKVPDFMRELCSAKEHVFRGWDGKSEPVNGMHNQITILNSKIEPVDRESPVHKNYRYGASAVVQWSGVCEYVLRKEAYAEIIPEAITAELQEED